MKKNKKLILFGIVVILAVCLILALKNSTSLYGNNEISKEELPQASAEQNGGVSTQSDEANSNDENGVSVQDASVAVQSVNTSNWDLTKVDIVYDTANVAVPVPKGYVASGADGEHTVNTGFVIYEGTTAVTNSNAWNESCTRNQWVWVPVPDVSRIYETDANGKKKSKLYQFSSTGRSTYTNSNYEPGVLSALDTEEDFGWQGTTKKMFLNELQNEFEETIKSIEKYGGFYIGRYETGNLSADEPVVQRMNTSISSQNWYTEYKKIKRMSTDVNVSTSMIWGCLWDETLQWLVDSGAKTYAEMKDSTSWGNYNNSTFEYKTNISGSTSTKNASSGTRIPSGSTEYSKANNIYDMAGNVWDWTLEGYGSSTRSYRGGSFGYNGSAFPASYRVGYYPYGSNGSIGFRAYFYIK